MGEGTAIHETLSVSYRASITKTMLENWMQIISQIICICLQYNYSQTYCRKEIFWLFVPKIHSAYRLSTFIEIQMKET